MKFLKTLLKNIGHYKSTILGTALLIGAYYLMKASIVVNPWILGGIILSGILLWIAPDKYINILEKFIGIAKDKKKCDDQGEV